METISKPQIKFTPLGSSYWNNTGAYTKELDELYKRFVPASGAASTTHGELIRAINRLYYEYCNNGNINAYDIEAVEDEDICDSDVTITDFFQAFIDLIYIKLSNRFPNEDIQSMCSYIESIIKQGPYQNSDYFNDIRMNKYDLIMDWVIYYVLTTEDSSLPEEYLQRQNQK